MALEEELKVYKFLSGYSEALLDGLDADEANVLICEGSVNPAWIIGHLGLVSNVVVEMLGGEAKIDTEVWGKLFGIGSTPSIDASAYPAWDELLAVYRRGQDEVAAAVASVTDEKLNEPNPMDSMREALPTVRASVGFVLSGHVGFHLGQLSTWRRKQGHAPLF